MNLTCLTMGAAALGLLAATIPARAMPIAPLAPAVGVASDVSKAHFSRYPHKHRDHQIVWTTEQGRIAAAEARGMATGRSVSKQKGGKYTGPQNMAPHGRSQGATQGRSAVSPRAGNAPYSDIPHKIMNQGKQKGSQQQKGGH